MSTEQPTGDPMPGIDTTTAGSPPFEPQPEPAAAPAGEIPEQLLNLVASEVSSAMVRQFLVLTVAKATRAADRLRAQRKRHAQRLAAMQAKIEEAEAKNREAMEIVRYVVGWGPDLYYGPGPIGIDHDIYIQAAALVAREGERKSEGTT